MNLEERQQAVINRGYAKEIYEFALNEPKRDPKLLSEALVNSKRIVDKYYINFSGDEYPIYGDEPLGYYLCSFARDIDGADKKIIEDKLFELIKYNGTKYLEKYIDEVKNANLNRVAYGIKNYIVKHSKKGEEFLNPYIELLVKIKEKQSKERIMEIDRDAHYFALMHPLEGVYLPPLGAIVYTSSSTREKWVECEIVEDRYRLQDGYKVELSSIEPGYGRASFYIDDFKTELVRNTRVVKKEPDMECVEETWLEPLTNNVNICHSAYTLKFKPKHK